MSCSENTYIPTFLWVLGFFLGDGSMFVSLKWLTKGPRIQFIPVFIMVQKATSYNAFFMSLMADCLSTLGIHNNTLTQSASTGKDKDRPAMLRLIVEGQTAVLFGIIPLLTQYVHFLYWKGPQYSNMLWLLRLISTGTHLSYLGIFAVITKLQPADISL